ncbi:MAG: glutamate--tRNA ligase [Marinilabilia sp.]
MSNQKIRVRFAPSPTGPLHMGGVRTALFNYLFAKKHGGDFILRIEDTDQNEEMEQLRKEAEAKKETFSYSIQTRGLLNNSLNLPPEEVKRKMEAGESYVIRFNMPEDLDITENDIIRGKVTFNTTKSLDDKVLFKSDGMPTYHLANVVDDHLMEISHVIRGEEWLPSAPLHVLLYRYLGWEDSMPQFAHLPLLLKPDGNGKLSKRDSLKHGFPVFPMEWTDEEGNYLRGFREDGYLPEAFINFLAFLGWNPGTEQELFSKEELVQAFRIAGINKAGAKFDINKAKWYNQQYLRRMDDEHLAELLMARLSKEGIESSRERAIKVCGLMKERVTFIDEIWENAPFFYQPPQRYDEKVVNKKWTEDATLILKDYAEALKAHPDELNADAAKAILDKVLEKRGENMGKVMQALRLALTGEGSGPDLMPTIEVLGKDESASRIENALQKLGDQIKNIN